MIHRKLGEQILISNGTGETLTIEIHKIREKEVSLVFLNGKSFHVDRAEYREKKDKQDKIKDVNGNC